MKLLFQIMSFIHVTLYRLTNGGMGGKMNGVDILLLTTTGRKSGKTRTTPLMYFQDSGKYFITASAGGADQHPGWYWNAAKSTQPVQIQVNDDVMTVNVEEAPTQERDRLYQRFIEMLDQFAGYEKKTGRTIPVLILTPQ